MSSLFYFGAPPFKSQKVSSDLAAKGLNYIRTSPSEVFPTITRDFTTPQYEVYCSQFAAFVKSVVTKKPVPLDQEVVYFPNPSKKMPELFNDYSIIWSYDEDVNAEKVAEICGRYNAVTTPAKGKNAFLADLKPSQIASLLKSDLVPSLTTPSTTSNMNIATFKAYNKLMKLADTFFRVHQYSLVKYGEDEIKLDRDFVYIGDWERGEGEMA